MDDKTHSNNNKNDNEQLSDQPTQDAGGAGNWGGWGFSSILSDLQKAAAVAAEEISRNVRFTTIRCRFMHSF